MNDLLKWEIITIIDVAVENQVNIHIKNQEKHFAQSISTEQKGSYNTQLKIDTTVNTYQTLYNTLKNF